MVHNVETNQSPLELAVVVLGDGDIQPGGGVCRCSGAGVQRFRQEPTCPHSTVPTKSLLLLWRLSISSGRAHHDQSTMTGVTTTLQRKRAPWRCVALGRSGATKATRRDAARWRARNIPVPSPENRAHLVSGDQHCVQVTHLGDVLKQLAHRSHAIRSLSVTQE